MSGFFKRFWGTVQWTVFAGAAASMFAVSLVSSVGNMGTDKAHKRSAVNRLILFQVPFTFIEYDSNSRLWPGVRQAYEMVDRYQVVNSYGLFRRMTGVGGRPEVVIEGSSDGVTWTVRT